VGTVIGHDRLVHDLSSAGIGPGHRLIVHSSLRSLGRVRGGAGTVVEAFQHALGPSGTLLMPTFTYSIRSWGQGPFDRQASPSRVGRVSETLRRSPGAVRSDHPTHSFVAWGAHAHEAAGEHVSAVGRRSPLSWLLDQGGSVVQLGTEHSTNTALHLCEELAGVPYLDVAFTEDQSFETAQRRGADGAIESVRVEPVPGCSQGFARVEPVLAAAGVVEEAQVGQARTMITSLPALAGVVTAALKRHPGLLLCTRPECSICPRRRAVVHTDRARWERDLIDLFIAGSEGGLRLTWAEQEAVDTEARSAAQRALADLGDVGDDGLAALEERLASLGVAIEESGEDEFTFSLWDPGGNRLRLSGGALQRLAETLSRAEGPMGSPLHRIGECDLRALALAHEGFRALSPRRAGSLQGRLAEEIGARLFADRLLRLPVPSVQIDVWLMLWAPEALGHAPRAPGEV
jgi:aminoglycoside 3-N-acetyltransferase